MNGDDVAGTYVLLTFLYETWMMTAAFLPSIHVCTDK
jgi:hypothetical protein